MNVTRHIDPERRIVYTTITGEITLDEIRADMARLAAEPSYAPDMPGLVDMRNATTKMTVGQIEELTQALAASPKVVHRARRALLVSGDLMYGLYRMFESFSAVGSTEYHVFRDERAARAWVEEEAERRAI